MTTMDVLDKERLPQNWRAPLIKVVSNYVWQNCDRVDLTDPHNHPSPDGSGKSPAYGAYAGPVEHLLNTAFEGALKNWEIGPFAAWVGQTRTFNELNLQWDFAISLPNQHLTRPLSVPTTPEASATSARSAPSDSWGNNPFSARADSSSSDAMSSGSGPLSSLPAREEEDIPVEEQWSIVVWLKPGDRGTAIDMTRFVAVVDRMASPAFSKAVSGSWDVFLSHYQQNAGNTVMSLKALLEAAAPGLRCWLDKDEDASEGGMRRGVANSSYFLLFLTAGVLTRPFCQLEAREALRLGKQVILVHETDPRFGAAHSFNQYIEETPADIRPIFNSAASIPWYREEEFRLVSIKKILAAAGRSI